MNFLKVFFLLCFTLTSVVALADRWYEDIMNVRWKYTVRNNREVVILGIEKDTSGKIIIPTDINGLPVKSIDTSAFLWCSKVNEVFIPNSITNIGVSAFAHTSIRSIKLPENITHISKYMFSGCEYLQSIRIPSNVTNIGDYAFSSCENFRSISLPERVKSIGKGVFSRCENLERIYGIENIRLIGDGALKGCKKLFRGTAFNVYRDVLYDYHGDWYNVTIPNEIQEISSYAFEGYGYHPIVHLIIPESVKKVNKAAFCRSRIKKISLPNNIRNIEDSVFSGSYIESIVLPNSLTNIGRYAFKDCHFIKEIVIPDSVVSIGEGAFEGCENLATIRIPNSVVSIGEGAF